MTRYIGGATLFTVNLHLVAKLDSSSTQGNARPPVNSPVEQRTSQVELVAVSIENASSGVYSRVFPLSLGLRPVYSRH